MNNLYVFVELAIGLVYLIQKQKYSFIIIPKECLDCDQQRHLLIQTILIFDKG